LLEILAPMSIRGMFSPVDDDGIGMIGRVCSAFGIFVMVVWVCLHAGVVGLSVIARGTSRLGSLQW